MVITDVSGVVEYVTTKGLGRCIAFAESCLSGYKIIEMIKYKLYHVHQTLFE